MVSTFYFFLALVGTSWIWPCVDASCSTLNGLELEDACELQQEADGLEASVSMLQILDHVSTESERKLAAQGSIDESIKGFRSIVVPYQVIVGGLNVITTLPGNLSTGDMYAYVPTNPISDDLHLFFAGSWVGCTDYSSFLEFVAKSLYTICLPYDNVESMATLCHGENECFFQQRLAAFDGDLHGVQGNNQQARLISALDWLNTQDSDSWGKYLDDLGAPTWSSIRVSGHSQGAGAAAMVGYKESVSRVVQFSGPNDASTWYVELGPPKTEATRFYGLDHVDNVQSAIMGMLALSAEGALSSHPPVYVALDNVTETASLIVQVGAQALLSTIPCRLPDCQPCTNCGNFGPGCNYDDITGHESIIMNRYWQDTGSNPYSTGLWQALMGI